jgi:hypothetical protein
VWSGVPPDANSARPRFARIAGYGQFVRVTVAALIKDIARTLL